MNWFKQGQQGLLFYPWEKSPEESFVHNEPIDKDNQGNPLYECFKCKNKFRREQMHSGINNDNITSSFYLPYKEEEVKKRFFEIHQHLLPIYNQFLEKSKDPNFNKNLWEVNSAPLISIIQRDQKLSDFASYSYTQFNPLLSLILSPPPTIDSKILKDLEYFLAEPEKVINHIISYSPLSDKNTFKTQTEKMLCVDCFAESQKCEVCKTPIYPNEIKYETTWDNKEFICDKCIQEGNAEICDMCEKTEVMQDIIRIPNNESVCPACLEKKKEEGFNRVESIVSTLNLPIGKNIPINEKELKNISDFIHRYVNKYGETKITKKESERILYMAQKARLSQSNIEYLKIMLQIEENESISSLTEQVSNNIEAQEYIKTRYPNIKYKDFPYIIEVIPSYNEEDNSPGFTIAIRPNDLFFSYISKKFPNVDTEKIWMDMSEGTHHQDYLAYARCGYVLSGALIINNLQRDSDIDSYRAKNMSPSKEQLEVVKWIDSSTENWDIFLIDIIRAICISENANGFLTTFNHQKKKWDNLPIYKAKKTYQDIPERMGFEEVDIDDQTYVINEGKDSEMYQIANHHMNWFKKYSNNLEQKSLNEDGDKNNFSEEEIEKSLSGLPVDTSDKWDYTDDAMYDFHEAQDSYIYEQVESFNRSKPGDKQPWEVIPLDRAKKIWRDYIKFGFVRDEKGINMMQEIVINNIQKIIANTIIAGHTRDDPEKLLKEQGLVLKESPEHDYGDWILDDRGQWRISDYALEKLSNIALELLSATTPEQKLLKIDHIFNVVHRRSDIASWFIEKGSQGLTELGNQ